MERNNKKSGKGSAEEPMAEWERELLEQHESAKTEKSAQTEEAASTEASAE